MKSWRVLRDEGTPEEKQWFEEVEVIQQPAGYCDGVIVAWIQEMRLREGYKRLITLMGPLWGMGAPCQALLLGHRSCAPL